MVLSGRSWLYRILVVRVVHQPLRLVNDPRNAGARCPVTVAFHEGTRFEGGTRERVMPYVGAYPERRITFRKRDENLRPGIAGAGLVRRPRRRRELRGNRIKIVMVAMVREQRTRERAEVPTLETGHVLDVDTGVGRENRADGMGSRLDSENGAQRQPHVEFHSLIRGPPQVQVERRAELDGRAQIGHAGTGRIPAHRGRGIGTDIQLDPVLPEQLAADAVAV